MAVQIPQLRVEEVSEKAASGATEPYFCRLSDDQLYVVKGRAALAKGLISEVVCGILGRAYGLPIPPIALAELDSALVALNPAAQASLGSGIVFASTYREHLVELSREMIDASDQIVLRKLFLFDYWIRNEDRTGTVYGGNSNLFRDIESRELVVLDHNLAFSETFDVDAFVNLHICRDFWFSRDRLHLDRPQLLDEMDAATAALDDIEDSIPEAWLEAQPDEIERLRRVLSTRTDDKFWTTL